MARAVLKIPGTGPGELVVIRFDCPTEKIVDPGQVAVPVIRCGPGMQGVLKGSDQRENRGVWSNINTRYLVWRCGDGRSFDL